MKNKKSIYILIPSVLIVWGLIIKQIYLAVTGNDDDIPVATVVNKKEPYNDYSIPKDTTKLLLNYRDPFGVDKPKDTAEVAIKKLTRPISIRPAVAAPVINWSFIQYVGYMHNAGAKKLVAVVRINGNSRTMAEGENADGVKLIKNYRDSIKVGFNGKTKSILMNH